MASQGRQHRRFAFAGKDLIFAAVLISAGVYLVWTTRWSTTAHLPLPSDLIQIGNRPRLGRPTAHVVVMAFVDLQSVLCRRFHTDVVVPIIPDYVDTGIAQILYSNLPSANDKLSMISAQHAACTARQGRYWDYVNELFRGPLIKTESDFHSAVERVVLDKTSLSHCLADSGRLLDADGLLANQLKVPRTPTVLIGTLQAGSTLRVLEIQGSDRPRVNLRRAIETARAR